MCPHLGVLGEQPGRLLAVVEAKAVKIIPPVRARAVVKEMPKNVFHQGVLAGLLASMLKPLATMTVAEHPWDPTSRVPRSPSAPPSELWGQTRRQEPSCPPFALGRRDSALIIGQILPTHGHSPRLRRRDMAHQLSQLNVIDSIVVPQWRSMSCMYLAASRSCSSPSFFSNQDSSCRIA
jgi:hypothetical protein